MLMWRRLLLSTVVLFSYILFWALVYTFFFHGQFRFEGVEYGPAYKKEKLFVESTISDLLMSQHEQVTKIVDRSQSLLPDYAINKLGVQLSVEDVTEGNIDFSGEYYLWSSGPLECIVEIYSPIECSINGHAGQHYESVYIDNCRLVTIDPYGIYSYSVPIFDCIASGNVADEYHREFDRKFSITLYSLPHDEIARIHDFTRSKTHLREGIFPKMLYLSAVTATTLGYGDIVPVTDFSRLAIAAQATVGLLVFGWMIFFITSGRFREGSP
ncbi:two pore domain potassium channel family protein [Roseibium polysiphoniae]|uniref:Two pore domain potassium channel family protein n=1 Tax=Roseibium polysiphoniae TaxID=2571221 RepID=A0A944CB48_9HYPH|nr:potassium channel family protein [Roseibium polysiphoniae]MBS8259709.1 two pore domain potassium channel family protein [Roseibium polysiphoniae]